jgi:hypothetical protein
MASDGSSFQLGSPLSKMRGFVVPAEFRQRICLPLNVLSKVAGIYRGTLLAASSDRCAVHFRHLRFLPVKQVGFHPSLILLPAALGAFVSRARGVIPVPVLLVVLYISLCFLSIL